MPAERRLAAIMFTDIVGYTALMAESEERGLRARERHRELVRPLVAEYHGESIEARGDESLSVFRTALDAVNCALAISSRAEAEADLKLHIGIHLGDVVLRAGEVSGDGVNIAARICALADGEAPYVSFEVRQAVRNQANFEAEALGEHELKNVGRPISVFRIRGQPGAPSPAPIRAPTPGQSVSLAVLPLENLSGDPEQEYFADGMTEALIGDLAKIGSLRVVSRTSVMQYKNVRKPLPEIAQELRVDVILEGTVIRGGDRVRIAAQLIDARADAHLWSERYDGELSDALGLQSDVARAVAAAVRVELTPDEQAGLARPSAVDPAAYDAYLRGLQQRGPVTTVQIWGPEAIEQFKRAVELAPDFGRAWAALALTRARLGIVGMNLQFRDELPRAREAAERALDLDESMGAAHLAMAAVLQRYDWDLRGAHCALQRAVELSPNDPDVLDVYAQALLEQGRTDEALAIMARLLDVAPLDVFYRGELFRNYVFGRMFERALVEAERVKELDPGWFDSELNLVYFKLGRLAEAHSAQVEFLRRNPAFAPLRQAAERGWAEGGWEASIRAMLELLTKTPGISPNLVAHFHMLIEDRDEAIAWLERGFEERDPTMPNLRRHPIWDPLRSDPRFQDLVRRIGFPES